MEYKGDTCVICEGTPAAWHHIFYGTANRQLSDKYGFVVSLCPEHHWTVHCKPNMGIDLMLKQTAQKDFEKQHSRAEFIRTFGRSYL